MSTITMTKKGNARMDGVKYKAVARPGGGCGGCSFGQIGCVDAHCESEERKDRGYKLEGAVIFVLQSDPPPTHHPTWKHHDRSQETH